MKYNFRLTKGPQNGEVKTVKGAKRVFDLQDGLLCYLKKGRLYDLYAREIAPCKSLKRASEEEISRTAGYCEDGKKVYFYGEETGIIEKKDHTPIILIFLVLLTFAAVVAMSFAMCVSVKDKVKTVTIIDKDGEWQADSVLDIFGNELLKPGVKGEYLFAVYNPNVFEMKADLKISFSYGGNTENLPLIIYGLTVNGAKTELVRTDYGYYAAELLIKAETRNSFMLSWEWKFETGNDEEDTEAGIKGEKYVCEIFITAEEI